MSNAPIVSEREEARCKRLQRKLARQDRTNKARGGKSDMYSSKRRARTVSEIKRLRSKQARRVEDWAHKTTTALVREYDLIALEDLKIKNMTRSSGVAKKGLNRSILSQSWGKTRAMLEYKASLAGVDLVMVDPAYTSQRCCKCGATAAASRENQATFRCTTCGYTTNADINAARNILRAAFNDTGQDDGLGRGDKIRPDRPHEGRVGTVDEASTPAPSPTW